MDVGRCHGVQGEVRGCVRAWKRGVGGRAIKRKQDVVKERGGGYSLILLAELADVPLSSSSSDSPSLSLPVCLSLCLSVCLCLSRSRFFHLFYLCLSLSPPLSLSTSVCRVFLVGGDGQEPLEGGGGDGRLPRFRRCEILSRSRRKAIFITASNPASRGLLDSDFVDSGVVYLDFRRLLPEFSMSYEAALMSRASSREPCCSHNW